MSAQRLLSRSLRNATDWNQNEDFFRCTRGRFVCRETEQMAQRYINFNMNELYRIAGKSAGKQCISVENCPDGMYNKAFILTMKTADRGQGAKSECRPVATHNCK